MKKTKADLTEYLAKAVLKKNANSQQLASHQQQATQEATETCTLRIPNITNHEKADTLMICLAAAASQQCLEARVVFFSSDTDVLVLAVAHYNKLCRNTAISMVSGSLEIGPIWSVLGREKAAALGYMYSTHSPVRQCWEIFWPWSKWFQQYMKVDREVISALMKLTEEGDVTQDVKDALAKFVCLLNCPKDIHITSVPDLRWHLLAESTKLPLTAGSLEQHIERVQYTYRLGCGPEPP